jgi:superfamily II DNA/RNA helicase
MTTPDPFAGVPAPLKSALEKRGFTQLTQVQAAVVAALAEAENEARNLRISSQTGSGKTVAVGIALAQRVFERATPAPDAPRRAGPSALVITPTRELAAQVQSELEWLFEAESSVRVDVVTGGTDVRREKQRLRVPANILVGTPGRLLDHIRSRALDCSTVCEVVLDEADQMLDMGFINDIRFLIGQLPEKRQSLCFSATITPEIQRLLNALLVDPVTVSVRTAETSEHVEQDVVHTTGKEQKLELLQELLGKPGFEKVLVFGQTKWGVQRLADSLTKNGFPAEAIHGNKSQPQRKRALQSFKDNRVKVLVATDVAARGLDIPNVSHVINFDQPNSYQDYIHRIGRTGRGGKRGNALTFIER